MCGSRKIKEKKSKKPNKSKENGASILRKKL